MEIFGTVHSVMAFNQFMTLPVTPFCSPSTPIKNPGWSTSSTSGMLNESHNTMKLCTFWQASASMAPPLNNGLLAITPMVLPSSRASAETSVLPKRAFISNIEPLSTMLAITLRMS